MTEKQDQISTNWNATPTLFTQLSQALLKANTVEEVLNACLDVITPTQVNGVTILLADGPPEDKYLEIAAAWDREGQPILPVGTRFSTREYLFDPILSAGQSIVVNDLTADEQVSERLQSILLQAKVKALAALPLGPAQDYFGAIIIDRAQAQPFLPQDIHIYEAVAALATGAIEKLRLIQDTQRALTETSALYELSRRLSKSKSVDDILQTLLDSDLFGAAGGSIALLEPSGQELVFWAAAGGGAEEILGRRMPVSEGVVGWVVREGQPALVPDAYADERFYHKMDTNIKFQTRSILCTPLRVEGDVIGAITLTNVRSEALGKGGLRLLSQITDQAALFIGHQKLLAETKRMAQDLSLLLDVSRDLTSTLERDKVLELVTRRATILVGGDECDLYLLQTNPQGEKILKAIATSSQYAEQVLAGTIKMGEGITGYVAQTGVAEIVNRVDLDPRSIQIPGTPTEPENLIAVPLLSKEQVVGVIIVNRVGERGFEEHDLQMMMAIAGHATTVLENTRLFEETQQRLQEQTTLFKGSQHLASAPLQTEEIAEIAVRQLAEMLETIECSFSLFNPQEGTLDVLVDLFVDEEGTEHLEKREDSYILADYPATARTMETQQPLVVQASDPAADPAELAYMQESGAATLVIIPLAAKGQAVGIIELETKEEHHYTPEQLNIAMTLANQAAVALDNASLYQQTQRSLAELQALYETSQAIATVSELEPVLQITINNMAEYVGADQCRAILFDPLLGYGQVRAEYRPTSDIEDIRVPIEDNPVYQLLRDEGQVIVIDDVRTHPLTTQTGETLIEYGAKSILIIPLIAQEQLIGSVELDAIQTNRTFSEAEINFCRTLADRAALTIENRRLFKQTQDTLRETTMLYRASRALTQTRDVQDVLQAITDNLPITQVDQCIIALIDPNSDLDNPTVEIVTMWDHEGDDSLLGTRFTRRELPFIIQPGKIKTWIVNDLEDEPLFDAQSVETLRALGVKSALFVPLMTGEMLLGWLALITHHQIHLFDPENVRPFQILADQAAVAIQNQRLFQQLQDSLEEVETVHRQYLRTEWATFLQSQEEQIKAILYDQGTLQPAQHLWHPLIEEAVSQGEIVTHKTHSTDGSIEPDDGDGRVSGSSIVTPLDVRGEIIGALGLEDPEQTHEWTMDDLSMVQEIADQVALAIENARLIETTSASLAETARLYEAAGRLSNANSVDETVNVLTQEIQTTLGHAYRGTIWRAGPDPSSNISWIEVDAQWNPLEEEHPPGTRLQTRDHPILDHFVGQRQLTIIRHSEIPPEDDVMQTIMGQGGPSVMIAIPMMVGDSWLGFVNIVSSEERTPDERTIRFLENLVDRAALAMEGIRLYEETQQRAIQLEAASKVSRAATSILEQDRLLSSVVELIRDHFNYYHAQIFLLDPTDNWAILKASTGEIGQKLLKRGHALEVGGPSLIGYVTDTGQPRNAYDVSEDAVHFENPDLPDTRSELAIPLQIGGRIIGALDVQSTERDAFGAEDVSVLSTLSDQLATAIENARLYQEQLETAEKLREVDMLKSQFMANMSHELRTPLNSIIGFSRVILKGIDGPVTDLQKQDLTAIYNSGQHLLELINNILDLSKIEAGKMEMSFEEVDLTEIIKGVMSTAVALVKDKPEIALRHTIAPDFPLIIADATRMRQVLLNLVSNASKFTDKGSVELNATYDARFVTIRVKDTGVGIPADKFDVLFKEFEQVDGSSTRAIGGTGLGLPISKHFVEMHGGSIWVESEVNVGSTFTVQLPIKGPHASEEEEEEKIILDSSRRLILAVDDDENVIQMYKRYLEQQDYQVIGLYESDQVIQQARELHPFAILLDIIMPEKDGWTTIQELKTDPETQDIPIIVCSIVDEAGHGFSLGASDYLVKPISEEQLLAALIRLSERVSLSSDKLKTVLIIDDTLEDRKLLRRILESASKTYQITEASNGLEGVAMIEQQQPNLIILDLMMPEMDGFAVLEVLKSDQDMRKIPIIIVTAKELTEQERNQINGQVAALLQKGLFKDTELFQDVDLALRRVRKQEKEKIKD